MFGKDFYWRNRELREHVAILDGTVSPTLVLQNGTYLNVFLKKWLQANIWIFRDRIVYVGSEMPEHLDDTEVIDCEGKFIVPGYIEPHAHPFQIYNPVELSVHAAKHGTTTLINDNLILALLLEQDNAFSLIEHIDELPMSMYWSVRYDSQSALQNEEELFNTDQIAEWLSHHLVVQGGELTAASRLLEGDDRFLHWVQKAKSYGKLVEGHLPRASERTLTKMRLLGISADHESISGAEALERLKQGYHVHLRNSSIRPDLPMMISDLLAAGIKTFEGISMTTDGSTPSFYENGLINICIEVAIKKGVPVEEAYNMATYYAAHYYRIDQQVGSIAPGKLAHLNILQAKDNPHPISVLAKGKWLMQDKEYFPIEQNINWQQYGMEKLNLSWELHSADLQFSAPLGLAMMNDAIIKPNIVNIDLTVDRLSSDNNEAFLLLIDRNGHWRVNSTINGFTKELGAFVSSYSVSGDIIMIGKDKQDMIIAFERMKELGGAIVLVNRGEIIFELPLHIGGMMFDGTMERLIEKEKIFIQHLKEFGYAYDDPISCVYFLCSIHLPYIRITQKGIIDVKRKNVLFPATMR